MEVSITDLLNQVEFVPVSLSDPFKSIIVDPTTLQILSFLPIIGFMALIIAAVWRQAKRFPVEVIVDLNKTIKQ